MRRVILNRFVPGPGGELLFLLPGSRNQQDSFAPHPEDGDEEDTDDSISDAGWELDDNAGSSDNWTDEEWEEGESEVELASGRSGNCLSSSSSSR